MTDKRGIGGWLLVFLLWLALTSGLSLLVGLRQTGYKRGALGAYGVLGVVTIVQLVRKQPSGVPLAKTLLVFVIGMLILEIGQVRTRQQGAGFTRNLIIAGLWLAYLAKSERVKNTFGSPQHDE